MEKQICRICQEPEREANYRMDGGREGFPVCSVCALIGLKQGVTVWRHIPKSALSSNVRRIHDKHKAS